MFYTWECLDAPTFIHHHVQSYASLYVCTPLGVYTPPICSPYSCVSVCSQRLLYVLGGCKGPPICWAPPLHLPLYKGASPSVYMPTHSLASLCISMFGGYLYVIWGILPLCWGCSPICWGFGASPCGVSICLTLYIPVVHYASHFYYSYHHYFSSYSGVLLGCHLFHQ